MTGEYVAVDTDVASLVFKHRLPPRMLAELVAHQICTTAVTFGELTQWAELRSWGPRRRERLTHWLDSVVVLPCDKEVARPWGRISAFATRRGRRRPANDSWIAACCLTYRVPLATLNVKDFAGFAEHEGLRLITE